MHVKLTHVQMNAIAPRLPTWLVDMMRENRVPYGRSQHLYWLPAIAWKHALDTLIGSAFGVRGGKLKNVGRPSDATYLAIGRIAEVVKRIEGHPAYRVSAVPGVATEVLPAFRLPGSQVASPYPNGGRFELLIPHHTRMNGRQFTMWGTASDVEARPLHAQGGPYREDVHLLVVRQSLDVGELSDVPQL